MLIIFFVLDPSTPVPLGVSAIIGIAVALVCTLFLVATIGTFCYYQRRKNALHRATRSRHDFIGPVEDLPYDIPPEALMRLPPPRYTSQDALAIANPGYRDDEPVVRPPPYYASRIDMSRLSLYDSLEPPPVYTSRLDLRGEDELTLAGNERMGLSTARSQATINVTAISSGILNDSIASALTLNNTLICNPEASSIPGMTPYQHQRRESSDSSSYNKTKKRTLEKSDVDKDTMTKRLSMSSSALMDPRIIENLQFTPLDVLKDDKPRSHSIQIEQGVIVEKPNMAAPVHHSDKDSVDSSKTVLRHSKHIAKSSPCLDFGEEDTKPCSKSGHNIHYVSHVKMPPEEKDNAGAKSPKKTAKHKSSSPRKVKSSPKKSKPTSRSQPTKALEPADQKAEGPKDIRIAANPDLSMWRAQILACSSLDPMQASLQALEDIPELDDTLTNSQGNNSSDASGMGRAQTVQCLHNPPSSKPSSFRSKPATLRQKSASLPQLYVHGQNMSVKLGSVSSLDAFDC